jgi:hypothetical protein
LEVDDERNMIVAKIKDKGEPTHSEKPEASGNMPNDGKSVDVTS